MPVPALELIRHKASIAGYVTDAVTGRAIAGAVVKITARNIETATAADGFYFISDLRAGLYTLNASAPGLGTRYGAVKITNVSVQNSADGRPVLDVKGNIALPPTRVTGYVRRSADAQPLKGARVQVLGSEAKTATDENGKYTILGLYAGAPNIQASADGYTAAVRKVSLTAGTETPADFSLVQI